MPGGLLMADPFWFVKSLELLRQLYLSVPSLYRDNSTRLHP